MRRRIDVGARQWFLCVLCLARELADRGVGGVVVEILVVGAGDQAKELRDAYLAKRNALEGDAA
jgi:hypothetical protein